VETANLDGETNLKVKSSPGVLVNTCNGRNGACDGLQNGSCNGSCHGSLPSPETIEQSLKNARVECETPNNQLYKFDGKWITGGVAGVETAKTTPPTERTETNNAQDSFHDCSSEANVTPLSVDNVLLRGSTLRNTRWALGLVVFTGGDSKLMKNATSAPTKKSRLETHMNLLVLSVGVFQTVVGLALAGLQREWVLGENPEVASAGDGSSTQRMRHWYLSPSNVWPDMEGANAGTFFTQFVRCVSGLSQIQAHCLRTLVECSTRNVCRS
jgi:magnesium-transporting ATPase (P-type)